MSMDVPDRFKATVNDFITMFGKGFALALTEPDDPCCEGMIDQDKIDFFLCMAHDFICANLAKCSDSGIVAVTKGFKYNQLLIARYMADPTKVSGVEADAYNGALEWIKEQCCEECNVPEADLELLCELGLTPRKERGTLMTRRCRIFTDESQQGYRHDRLYKSAVRRGREKLGSGECDPPCIRKSFQGTT